MLEMKNLYQAGASRKLLVGASRKRGRRAGAATRVKVATVSVRLLAAQGKNCLGPITFAGKSISVCGLHQSIGRDVARGNASGYVGVARKARVVELGQ